MTMGRSDEIDDPGGGHPDVDDLIGYARGELSQMEAKGLREHAAWCVDCGDQLAALILLREGRLDAEGGEVPVASVTRFPVPDEAPVRSWPRPAAAAAVAAAAALIFALVWFISPPPPTGQATADDRDLVAVASSSLRSVFDPGMQSAAVDDLSDETVIGLALDEILREDLRAARDRLEPFREGARWHRFGTSFLGYVLFVQEDPSARAVLEMYRARHEIQFWQANASTPEDLAFFFLARLRLADGDAAGAREAVAWISPRVGAGRAATAWLRETLGDEAKAVDPGPPR